MSYVSLIKNIPEIFSQPTGIAAIASVGIHGAIALIVPLMPVDSSKPREAAPRSVGILQLSQADQNRLPQTPDNSQLALQPQLPSPSPLPLQSQLPLQQQAITPNLDNQSAVLPPLPPPSYTQSILPPIATIPDNYRVASLPKRQPLKTDSRNDLGFDTSGFNAADKKFTPVPSFSDKNIEVGEAKPLPVDQLPVLPAAKIPGDMLNTASPNPADIPATTASGSNTTPQTMQPGNDASKIAQNQPQVAPISQTPKAGDNLTLAREGVPKWQPGATRNLPVLPAKTNEQSVLAQLNSYEDLRKTVQRAYPNSIEKGVIRDTISVNKPGLEGTVSGFLVVDSEGKVLDIFQDKSVSPDLQVKAREHFITKAPKGDRQTNRYPFSLRFQKNNSDSTAGVNQELKPTTVIPNPSSKPGVNNNQPTLTPGIQPEPAANLQPLLTPAAKPESETTVKPLSTPEANSNQLSPSAESGQKLIRELRDLKKQRQNSNPEK